MHLFIMGLVWPCGLGRVVILFKDPARLFTYQSEGKRAHFYILICIQDAL